MPMLRPLRHGLRVSILLRTHHPSLRTWCACRWRAAVNADARRMSMRIVIAAVVLLVLTAAAIVLLYPRSQTATEKTAPAQVLNPTTQYLVRGEYLARI